MTTTQSSRKLSTRGAAVGIAALVLLVSLPTLAMADHRQHRREYKHYKKHHRHGHGHGHYDRHDRHGPSRYYGYERDRYRHRTSRAFVVPRAIHHSHYSRWAPYYHGEVYYAPHSHTHRVYHFPAFSGGAYTYSPYAYCNGELYYGSRRPRGGISFYFGF